MPRLTGILLLAVALCAAARTAQAAEIGHFNGGILNIRDYFVPESGLYGGLYNYFYHTGRLNDRHGDAIHSVTINPRGGRGVTVGVDVDVDVDGTVQETVEGDDFARAFLAIWRGAKPPHPGVKAGLLGGACG